MKAFFKKTKRNQNGQSVVEFLLVLGTGALIVYFAFNGTKQGIIDQWEKIVCNLGRPCPTCKADCN